MDGRSVTCYPQPAKPRSRAVLEAFAAGCGSRSTASDLTALRPGAAAFYGALGLEHLLKAARAEGRDWYYGDNAFFDAARHKFFRFSRNEFQISSLARPNHKRLKQMAVAIAPWRRGGEHVVVVEQSEHFLSISGAGKNWLERVLAELAKSTSRRVVVRRWGRDKVKSSAGLPGDLAGAWALVTHTSAAAIGALLAGVPVFVSGSCAATPLASGVISSIESPRRPEGREDWAAGLAGMQWTLDEIRAGMAWRALHGS